MNVLQSMIIAFSMYSKLPMPHIAWQEKNMKYAMCFFPMVGIVIGICEYALGSWILGRDYGVLFFSACMTLLPILLTGGRTGVLRGAGKKAGDLKRFPHRGICGFGTWCLSDLEPCNVE